MAHRLVIDDLCDRHLVVDGAEVQAVSSVPVTLEGQPRVLDVCAECEAEVLGELRRLYARLRRPETEEKRRGQPQAKAKAHACPLCSSSFGARTTLTGHMTRAHGMSLGEYEAQQSGEGLACPDCPRSFSSAQGLSMHRRKTHATAPA